MDKKFLSGVFSRRRSFSLRMAPMIDMIFLLLIFFLVASKWRPKEDFLPLRLAAAQAQTITTAPLEPLLIYISANETGCDVQIGQSRTVRIENDTIEANLAVLMEQLAENMRAQGRYASDPVEIICSPQVKWEHLAKIYNCLFGAGATDITFRMTEEHNQTVADIEYRMPDVEHK